jgi:hypothetical protein
LRKAWALGRVAEAIDANAEAYRLTESTGERYYQAIILWQRGWLLSLDIDGLQTGRGCLWTDSCGCARRQQAKSLELRAAISLARLWAEQGKRAEARNLLARSTTGSPRALTQPI